MLTEILTRTPLYVWGVLALLMFLGIRRLTPRRTSLRTAAAAPIGFGMWSLANIAMLISAGGSASILVAGGVALLAGAASARVRTVPRPKPLPGGVFAFAGTAVPLIAYMAVFFVKYALQVWSAIVPAAAWTAALIGLIVTALMAGRTAADFLILFNMKRA